MQWFDSLARTMINDGSLRLIYSIVFLAGISEGFGTQSAVLFVNRVSRRHFALNLLLSGALALLGALAWVASVWLICQFVLQIPQRLALIARLITVGYLPLLFGFLVITPYLGPGIGVALHVFSFVVVVLAFQSKLMLPLPLAIAATIGGWLFIQLLRLITRQPLAFVSRWLWRVFSGREHKLAIDEIPLVLTKYMAEQESVEQRA